MVDKQSQFIVPHSSAGETTFNMYFAQWAALFCFAALLAEQLGLNQVWSLTKFVSFYFFWYSNDPEQHENHRFEKSPKCFKNIFNPFNHDSFPHESKQK